MNKTLELKNVSVSIDGKAIIHQLSLALEKGEITHELELERAKLMWGHETHRNKTRH